jgi:hypothetical protein
MPPSPGWETASASASRLFTPIPSSPPSNSETDPSPSPSPAEGDEWGHWSSDGTPEFGPAPDAPSDTPSTGRGLQVSKAGLRAAVGSGFRSVCRVVAAFVADEEARQLGIWTPDDDDVQDVARPLTNIVYRRLPDEARGGDVIDLMALGLAVAGYVGKSLSRHRQLQTMRALQAAQGVDVQEEQGATVHPGETLGRMPTFPGGGF